MARFIYSTLFLTLLAIPAFTQWVVDIPRNRLRGVTIASEAPPLTWDTIRSGTFQTTAERRFKEQLPLWPYLVRSENQLNVSAFHQIGTSYSTQMILGKNDVLMHRTYLRHANKLKKVRKKQVQKTLDALVKLNTALTERKVSLILFISPNKPTLYPEYIPDSFRASKNHRQVKTLYERLQSKIESSGIPIFNAYEFLRNLKHTEEIPLFPASGSHWSDYSACLISDRLTETIENLLHKRLPRFSCKKAGMREIPLNFDRDHASVANVWFPQPFLQPTLAVEHKSIPSGEEPYRPRITIVGTSFIWSILRYLDSHRVYRERDFYFYFKTNYRFPGNSRRPIRPRKLDWQNHIFNRDVIILEVNEAWIDKVGYGFVGQALRQLSRKPQ
jgi:hypothetical protein